MAGARPRRLHIACALRLSFVQGFAARFTAGRPDSDVEERRLVGPPALTQQEIEGHGTATLMSRSA